MRPITSEIVIWEEAGQLRTWFRTNVSSQHVLFALEHIGLRDCVLAIGSARKDPLHGGSCFVIDWKPAVTRDDLRAAFARL